MYMKSKGLILIPLLPSTWLRNNCLKSSPFHYEDCNIYWSHECQTPYLHFLFALGLLILTYKPFLSVTEHYLADCINFCSDTYMPIKLYVPLSHAFSGWTWILSLPQITKECHGLSSLSPSTLHASRIILALASLRNKMSLSLVYVRTRL